MEPRIGGNGRGVLAQDILHGAAVTSMLAPINKQGHLGDLEGKSRVELEELLERQDKLLSNRKFIMRLPDKGEKIQKFEATLRELIAKKTVKEENADMVDSNTESLTPAKNISRNEAAPPDAHMETGMEDDLKVIERGFEQLSVHEGPFYQVVVKAEERTRQKSRFALNRPHKKDSEELNPRKAMTEESTHLQHHLKNAELTSASMSNPVHGSATVISVDECRSLFTDQQRKIQEIKSQHWFDRITRSVNASRHPEGAYGSGGGRSMEEEVVDFEEEPKQDYMDAVD